MKDQRNAGDPDPFEIYGSGMSGYFSIMRYLCGMFFVFALVQIPLLAIYDSGETLSFVNDLIAISKVSLGNLGQTEPVCNYHYMHVYKD